MSDRPTPETDAAEFLANEIGSFVVESRLARRLEQERDRLREINRELLEALKECLVAGVLSAPATFQARAAIAETKGGEA